MFRTTALLTTAVAAVALAGCGGSGSVVTTTKPPAAAATSHAVATATATAAAAGGSAPQPTPGSTDPCTLMTTQEVMLVSGLTTGPGRSGVAGAQRSCIFSAGGAHQLVVLLHQGGDASAEKAYYEAQKAGIPSAVHITELPTFDDGAVIGRAATAAYTGSGIYVLDGSNFFAITCGLVAAGQCSDTELQASATFVTGRL